MYAELHNATYQHEEHWLQILGICLFAYKYKYLYIYINMFIMLPFVRALANKHQ